MNKIEDVLTSQSGESTSEAKDKIEDVLMPQAGESVSEAMILLMHVKVGQSVKKDQDLFEFESDKATLTASASISGVVTEIFFKVNDVVPVGSVVCRIDGSAANLVEEKASIKETTTESVKEVSTKQPQSGDVVRSSPSATREAALNDLDLSKESGTGLNGMITKADISGLSSSKTDNSKVNDTNIKVDAIKNDNSGIQSANRAGDFIEQSTTVKMSMLRKTIARRLKEAQNTAAILTTFNEVDMSAVMNMRKKHQDDFQKKHGVKLGFMSFFIKAATLALQEIPAVNAQIDNENIIYKNYCHISVAIGTEKGLVVPVIRHCEKLSFNEIEKEIISYGGKATKGQLTPDDFIGGTFTISNGGTYGSMMSTPIINPPQSAILGMHSITERAMVVDGQIVIKPMMYLALSYDHRIIDGKEAVTFLVKIKNYIENPQRMLLSC